MRTQENTNQVNIKSSNPPPVQKEQHKFTTVFQGQHNTVLDLGLNASSEAIPEFVMKCKKFRHCNS